MPTKRTTKRIGPRMRELCAILRSRGGRVDCKSDAYMSLDYHGHASNEFGSAVMQRCIDAGLIAPGARLASDRTPGNAIPVELTPKGWEL